MRAKLLVEASQAWIDVSFHSCGTLVATGAYGDLSRVYGVYEGFPGLAVK